jgi:membrane-associated phospholipid phosphatase
MPFLIDIVVALSTGIAALLVASLYSRSSVVPARPTLEPARAVGESIRHHRRLRRMLASRLDRSVVTGFLLTLALSVAFVTAVVVGMLAYFIRTLPVLQRIDDSVAAWAYDHRTSLSTRGLHAVTDLGSTEVVIVLALSLVVIDFIRTSDRWCAPFLLTVMGGKELLTLTVKDLVGRVRPALDPVAATLGPSFPSGHSATAAAFYAAAALILGRRLAHRGRHLLVGLAVATAVAVAASRVLLNLHWFSDVIGGLALGWGWFALCAAIFGGRLLRPTATVDEVAKAASDLPGAGPISAKRRNSAGSATRAS